MPWRNFGEGAHGCGTTVTDAKMVYNHSISIAIPQLYGISPLNLSCIYIYMIVIYHIWYARRPAGASADAQGTVPWSIWAELENVSQQTIPRFTRDGWSVVVVPPIFFHRWYWPSQIGGSCSWWDFGMLEPALPAAFGRERKDTFARCPWESKTWRCSGASHCQVTNGGTGGVGWMILSGTTFDMQKGTVMLFHYCPGLPWKFMRIRGLWSLWLEGRFRNHFLNTRPLSQRQGQGVGMSLGARTSSQQPEQFGLGCLVGIPVTQLEHAGTVAGWIHSPKHSIPPKKHWIILELREVWEVWGRYGRSGNTKNGGWINTWQVWHRATKADATAGIWRWRSLWRSVAWGCRR